jgi:hypothetical protein
MPKFKCPKSFFFVVPATGRSHIRESGAYELSPLVERTPSFALLSKPLEQGWNVDLIGLVVAGERIHHDVDAGAEGEFTLTRLR